MRFIIKEISLNLYKEFLNFFLITIIRFGLVYFIGFICDFLNLVNTNKFLFELLNLFNELGGYVVVIN